MKKTLRLGTRKSLLAMTQSTWVAREIEKKNANIKVELIGLETQGDLILDIPLSQIEGKEFFIKELDDALLQKKVDFTVHSLKDLSVERPTFFFSASIPERALSNDFLIFHNKTFDKIKKNLKIKIGTSAPRRLENTPVFLDTVFLNEQNKNYDFVEIRGNVNTRLSRLHLPDSDPKALDGVVLAAAGLIRLSENTNSNKELKTLLESTSIHVLPLSLCPPAPGQGALALECLSEREDIQKILLSIHDETSKDQIQKERAALLEYGGGCHQRFGAASMNIENLGSVFIVKGRTHSGEAIDRYEFQKPEIHFNEDKSSLIFDGSQWKSQTSRVPYSLEKIQNNSHFFIAHHRVLGKPGEWDQSLISELKKPGKTIWTSGLESWKKLSSLGCIAQGCLENLGLPYFQKYLQTPLLSLPPLSQWVILTNQEAQESWGDTTVVAPYSSQYILDEATLELARKAKYFYWQSPAQFEKLSSYLPKNAVHFCGPGKTYRYLSCKNLSSLYVFPYSLLWKNWLKSNGVRI